MPISQVPWIESISLAPLTRRAEPVEAAFVADIVLVTVVVILRMKDRDMTVR